MPHEGEKKNVITPERRADIAYLSNLQSLRVNSFRPYNAREKSQIVTTSFQNLDHKLISIGRVYLVLTSVSAVEGTNAATRIELSVVRGGNEHTLTVQNISTAELSCDWNGQTICTEDDVIRAKFVGGTSANVIESTIQGYTIEI